MVQHNEGPLSELFWSGLNSELMLFGVSFDIAVNQVLFILLLIEEVNYNDAVVDHEDLFEGGVFVFGLDRIFQLVLMLDDCALRVHNEIDNIEISSGKFI